MVCTEELVFAQLIIEILQRGSNMSTAPELVSNNISTTLHGEVYHEMNNNWKLVTSRQSSDPKRLMEHVTVPNSQTFATSNWYSVLAGLRETDRSGESEVKNHHPSIRKH
jgi:hypothetical protein